MDFFEKLKETINEGLNISKDLYYKAKEKTKELGEIGVLKIEIKQLEMQVEKLLTKLGTQTYESLQKGTAVQQEVPIFKELIDQISECNRKIKEKEEALEKIGKKE